MAFLITFNFFGFGAGSVNFDGQKLGKPPVDWTLAATGTSQTPNWEVLRDSTAPSRPNILRQLTTTFTDSQDALAIFDKTTCRDGELSVKFKISSGPRRIRSAGMVWRYQNPRNYYLIRFSIDEGDIALFRVRDGQMRAIPGSVRHKLQTGQWYAAKVNFKGPRFHVVFDNRQLFDVTDDTLTTAGTTGLWTQAGTVASFDDFRIDKKG